MNEISIIAQSGGILGAFSDDGKQAPSVGMPFPTTIVLHEDIVVAGTTHIADLDCILENVEFPVQASFVRDPENLHDKWAIKVMLGDRRIGFVPCDINEVLARLMDGGKNDNGNHIRERTAWQMDQAAHGGEAR